MTLKPQKKFLKIAGIVSGSLIILLALFYWWFIYHAERAIEDIVSVQSNGKLKVELGKISYNYGRKLSIQNISFYTVDTAGEKIAYSFQVRQLHLSVKSIRSLVIHKQLLIDSILIQSPTITISRLRKVEQSPMSLPEEMGKIYESIEKALRVLEINRFQIDDAQFCLLDKTDPSLQPLAISKLHFHVDNFKVDTTANTQRDKFLFADNVALSSNHQSFMLPDGNHHIAFKNFNINIRNRMVEMDSCTITAYRHHGTLPVFRMFVDTLMLTNVDFLALSRHGLIRADSVYLVNSDIRLNIPEDSLQHHIKNKKQLNIQKILSGIASDMQLAYIGVKNSSINVSTEANNQTNTFSSSGNNFEMYNVVVDNKAEQPISVEQFLMAIRNYESYGKDSAYRLQFDSVRFTNNTVRLNNFSITTLPGARVPANRNYTVPLFELKGLSWQDLLFHRHIAAHEAVLHNPVLYYEKLPWQDSSDKRSIYELFTVLDTIINLRRISMVNGKLDFKLNSNTRIALNNVNGSVNTDRLLRATSSGFIESSVENLAFSKGNITTKHLVVDMDRAYFAGDSRSLIIRKFNLHHKEQNVKLSANDLSLQDLLLNDSSHLLRIDHISWKNANLDIEIKKKRSDSASGSLPLTVIADGIQLNNTNISFRKDHQLLKTFVKQISAGSIIKEPQLALQLNQIHLTGGPLEFSEPGTVIGISDYTISEGSDSELRNIQIKHYQHQNSMDLYAASLQCIPYLQAVATGNARFRNVVLTDPTLKMVSHQRAKPTAQKNEKWPDIQMSSLEILRPSIDIKQYKDSSVKHFYFKAAEPSDKLTLTDIRTSNKLHNQFDAADMHWQSSHFVFNESGPDSALISSGPLTLTLKDIRVRQSSGLSTTALLQHLTIKDFEKYNGGKGDSLRADSLCLENLVFNSVWLKEPEHFFRYSPAMSVHHFSGFHISRKNHFAWKDLRYSNHLKELSLDSFSYSPVPTRDEFIAASPFQTDYIQAKTGRITIKDIEPRLYFSDSTLNISTVSIQSPVIKVYRDKRPPFQHGIYKPLPTALIQKMPFPFTIDTILISNMNAEYAELSAKTHQTGVVEFTDINAALYPVRNIDLTDTDSLHLRASASLMKEVGISLRMDESYTDSLKGFFLDVHMSRAYLPVLNPVLEPLASIKIRKGELDTLILHAVGRDYLSLGEMQMWYKNLNIQLLKNGTMEKTSFVTRLASWAANHLVLRKQNARKTGAVYFPRFRDRSVFNYWVKIALSGAASSVGVKKNRKYIRQYHKALRKNELPPIQHLQ